MSTIYDIITQRRTTRQFKPLSIGRHLLEKVVNAGRLAPSAANLQPLEFIVLDDAEVTRSFFPFLRWAAYIAPEGNPKPGREPAAYIVTLVNTSVREKMFEYDVGAAMENMILAAWAEGIAGCWLMNIEREKIKGILAVPDGYRIDCVLALGYPSEEPRLEEMTDSCRYWKDENGIFHVPKRKLENVVHFNKF